MSVDNKNIKKTKIPIDIVSINCLTPDQSIKALDYSTNSLLFNNSFLHFLFPYFSHQLFL